MFVGKYYFSIVMISNELKNLLIQTVTSWQVIVVTLALIVYFSLVSYIVRFHHKLNVAAPKTKSKLKKEKKAPAKIAAATKDAE